MTLWSLSELSNLGPVTETGSSVSWVNTAREQVASKPMPRMECGSTLCWAIARWTDVQIQRQMSFVDCSYEEMK
jgi:predicted nucleic acid-binding protein